VDCLVCHSNTYQRALGPQTVDVTVTDWQGNTKTYHTPEKISGDYRMQPRYDLMPPGTTMTQLARTVTTPDRATCLRCHAKAGGSDGAKRGDISTADVNPSVKHDVHMSPQGANLLCQNCHTVSNHKIAGKGIDLRVEEGAAKVRCENCHTATPHDNRDLTEHTARVACQT
jgi:RNase P subunit RPR2